MVYFSWKYIMALPINLNSNYNNTHSAPFSYNFEPNKANGKYSYPVGIVSGNMAPITNKDYNNDIFYKPGSTRPQKWQYRRQTAQKRVIVVDPNNPNNYIEEVNGNNRISNSQATSSLISNLIDKPGAYSVKLNTENEVNNIQQLENECSNCDGIAVIVDFKPETYLTNNPDERTTNKGFCCNNEAKAKKMVIYANTNLKNNYFNTLQQYRQNRCLTYDQRAFNFQSKIITSTNPNVTAEELKYAKPGSPLALSNMYIANCYPNAGQPSQYDLVNQLFQLINNDPRDLFSQEDIDIYYSLQLQTLFEFNNFLSTINNANITSQMFLTFINNPLIISQLSSNNKNCKTVVYKPSNYIFACEGGVDSSLRTQKLTVDTIGKNLASINPLRGASNNVSNIGGQPFVPFIYKNKTEKCSPVLPVFFRNVNYKNKTCYNNDIIFWKEVMKNGYSP